MADVITRLRVESSEYDSKIKRAQQGIMQLEQSLRNSSRSFADATKEEVAYVRALGNMQTVSNTAKGKVNELTSAFTELSLTYKRMSDQEKQSPIGQALSQSLNQLKTRINETKGQLSEVNKELGNTKTEGDAAGGSLDSLSSAFGINAQMLTKWGSTLALGTAALKVAKDAFFESESNIDEWGRVLEGAKGAYEAFLDSLNGASWGTFFTNISNAYGAARDLYDMMDRLSSIKGNNRTAIADAQTKVQELRLRKQQGENVALELKAAEGRLKFLRSAEANQTKITGRQMIENTIRNGYGAGRTDLSAQELRDISNAYLTRGNEYVEEQRATAARLRAKGMDTNTTIFGTEKFFNIQKLDEAEQKIYRIANAVSEGESRLMKGNDLYAQGIELEGRSFQEEFRANRYMNARPLGGGGGGGSKGGKGGGAVTNAILSVLPVDELQVATVGTTTSMKELQARLNAYNAQLSTATTSGEYAAATQGIADTKKAMSLQQTALKMGWSIEDTAAFQEQLDEMAKNIQPVQIPAELNVDGSASTTAKETADGWKSAAQAVNQVSGALAGLEDPAAKIAGIVGQAIANIALGFATATAKDTKLGVFGWIAAIAGGLATMISTISAIKSATAGSYADGGIVPGNSYSGDRLTANVNSGELILNAAQQNTLASQLMSAGSAMYLEAVVSGEQLRFVLNNNSRRRSRGEYVTTLMRN